MTYYSETGWNERNRQIALKYLNGATHDELIAATNLQRRSLHTLTSGVLIHAVKLAGISVAPGQHLSLPVLQQYKDELRAVLAPKNADAEPNAYALALELKDTDLPILVTLCGIDNEVTVLSPDSLHIIFKRINSNEVTRDDFDRVLSLFEKHGFSKFKNRGSKTPKWVYVFKHSISDWVALQVMQELRAINASNIVQARTKSGVPNPIHAISVVMNDIDIAIISAITLFDQKIHHISVDHLQLKANMYLTQRSVVKSEIEHLLQLFISNGFAVDNNGAYAFEKELGALSAAILKELGDMERAIDSIVVNPIQTSIPFEEQLNVEASTEEGDVEAEHAESTDVFAPEEIEDTDEPVTTSNKPKVDAKFGISHREIEMLRAFLSETNIAAFTENQIFNVNDIFSRKPLMFQLFFRSMPFNLGGASLFMADALHVVKSYKINLTENEIHYIFNCLATAGLARYINATSERGAHLHFQKRNGFNNAYTILSVLKILIS